MADKVGTKSAWKCLIIGIKMEDKDKPTEQLIRELAALRQQNEELKASEIERKGMEELLQKRTHDLGERIKELNCLYGISNLVGKQGNSLEELFEDVIDLIPPA